MSLADPTSGVTTFQNAAEGVENLVGNGAIVVMGHSLGSALATYFVEDVGERLGPRATACLFASPRTGDSTWAAIFDQNVKQYSLFNYVLDLVPYVPTGIGYSTLPNATIIQPATAQAGVRLDLLCDHHVICYCYMLDFAQASAAPLTPQDAGCKACVLGNASTVPETAKALAILINDFGIGSEKAAILLKALHQTNAVRRSKARPVEVATRRQREQVARRSDANCGVRGSRSWMLFHGSGRRLLHFPQLIRPRLWIDS
jgi:hypothetical protein